MKKRFGKFDLYFRLTKLIDEYVSENAFKSIILDRINMEDCVYEKKDLPDRETISYWCDEVCSFMSLTYSNDLNRYFFYFNGDTIKLPFGFFGKFDEEEKSETVEEKPVETSENYGTISKSETLFDSDFEEWCKAVEFAEDFRIACQFDYYEPDPELPQQHLVFEGYEEYENSLSSFDELASMVGCENFTDEECAKELSYLLYADVDLANEYLHELHPFDQETLYAFYVAAKDGFNTSWKYNDDAPLGLYCDGKKIFFAYSEEEKGGI